MENKTVVTREDGITTNATLMLGTALLRVRGGIGAALMGSVLTATKTANDPIAEDILKQSLKVMNGLVTGNEDPSYQPITKADLFAEIRRIARSTGETDAVAPV